MRSERSCAASEKWRSHGDVDEGWRDGAGDRFAPRPGGWKDEGQVAAYLDRMDVLAPRLAGENALTGVLPAEPRCVLDLGLATAGSVHWWLWPGRPSNRPYSWTGTHPAVVATDGRIGESTAGEIEYGESLGKTIRIWNPVGLG